MNDLTITDNFPTWTREETSAFILRVHQQVRGIRYSLLEAFLHKAHISYRYSNFTDFAKEELEIAMDQPTISHLVRWARVEYNLFGNKVFEGDSDKLPRMVAFELARIEDPDGQREVYDRLVALKAHGCRLPHEQQRELKNLVANYERIQKDKQAIASAKSDPKPPAMQDPEPEPPKPDFFDTPAPSPALVAPEPAAPTVKPTPSAVSSFTPKPDEPAYEEEEVFHLDFEDAKLAWETVGAWLDNEELDCTDKVQRDTFCTVGEIHKWIEWKMRQS